MTIWHTVTAAIYEATGHPFTLREATPVSGGDINASFRLHGRDGSSYFLKLNAAHHHDMFAAEAISLDVIAATSTLHAPRPVAHGSTAQHSYLVLEFLELTASGNARLLGERLAAMHRGSAPNFGFQKNNFIGTTAQENTWRDNWTDFWREQRLGVQLRLAAENGYAGELQYPGEHLLDTLPALFEDHAPQPSLLHGDLWGGNHAYLRDGTPTIFAQPPIMVIASATLP